jgi:hypothetical protein
VEVHFIEIAAASSGRNFRVHPGVMLASKTSYWRVGGCEEAGSLLFGDNDLEFQLP